MLTYQENESIFNLLVWAVAGRVRLADIPGSTTYSLVHKHCTRMHKPLHFHGIGELPQRARLRIVNFNFIQLRAVEAADHVELLLIWGRHSSHGTFWRVQMTHNLPLVVFDVVFFNGRYIVFTIISANGIDAIWHGHSCQCSTALVHGRYLFPLVLVDVVALHRAEARGIGWSTVAANGINFSIRPLTSSQLIAPADHGRALVPLVVPEVHELDTVLHLPIITTNDHQLIHILVLIMR